MKNVIHFLIFLAFLSKATTVSAQSFQRKDIVLSTIIPDNLSGRYNIGLEYFLTDKKDNNYISVALNGGVTSFNQLNQNIRGLNFILETNIYSDHYFLKKNLNDFGGLKISYGNLNNQTLRTKNNSYFIGITTGIQPLIAKKIVLKINSDIGYAKNGCTRIGSFQNQDKILYSGFTVNFNIGLGIRL